MKNAVLAVTAIAGIAASANAAWGYKYQFNTGSGWVSAASVDVTGGSVNVQFRVVAYADAGTLSSLMLDGSADPGSTNQVVAFNRYVGSEKFSNFGSAVNGDMLNAGMTRGELSSGGSTYLSNSLSGGNLIVGNTAVTSFASQLQLGTLQNFAPSQGGTPKLEWIIRQGSIKVGNNTVAAQNRVIVFSNNNRITAGSSGGDKWYRDQATNGSLDLTSAPPEGSSTDVAGTLTVVPTPGALALVGLGGLVAARRRRA